MRRYAELIRELDGWQETHPWSIEEPIGVSVLGQPLRLFSVGSGNIHIHLNAAMHANEWLTAVVLMRFGHRLCRLWQNRTGFEGHIWISLLRKYKLWMAPLVNPDGVQRVMDDDCGQWTDWKANIRGVDLNDQFPAGWERERKRRRRIAGLQTANSRNAVYGPGARDYGGERPLSEPEAQALVGLTERIPFAAVFALHSQGEEIYYNYEELEPIEAKQIATCMAEASGYRAVKLTGSDAGFKDWFIQQYRRPGFTVELGCGQNPLPYELWQEMLAKLEAMLLTALQFESTT